MKNLPERKNIRLKDYDYSQAGYYFVTICTKDRKKLLSEIVGGGFHTALICEVTPVGSEIMKCIEFISSRNSNINFHKYVIMPNHIHLIVILHNPKMDGCGNPPLQKIIGNLKSFTTKKYNDINNTKNQILWQRNYYDHIIRNEAAYNKIYEYIETNPLKWVDDEYYV